MGDQEPPVAFFRQGTSTFALTPGGPVILGMTPTDPGNPPPTSWRAGKETAFRFGPDKTIQECLAEVTSAAPPGRIPSLPDRVDPQRIWMEIDRTRRSHCPANNPRPRSRAVSRGDRVGQARVSRNEDGSILAERCTDSDLTHADLAGQLAVGGFRFPTSDEWEYALVRAHRPCSDGATTSHAIGQFAARW